MSRGARVMISNVDCVFVDITDQVAKESSDSNASSHELHQENTGATSGGSLSSMAHKAAPVRHT